MACVHTEQVCTRSALQAPSSLFAGPVLLPKLVGLKAEQHLQLLQLAVPFELSWLPHLLHHWDQHNNDVHHMSAPAIAAAGCSICAFLAAAPPAPLGSAQ